MKTNYHTHSVFCDGNNTIEEMAQTALEKGFDILGFSSHSMYPFSSEYHMNINQFESYCNKVREVQKLYEGKLQIQLGFEADYIPGVTCPEMSRYKQFNVDFLIGSVHYVPGNKGYFEADGSPNSVMEGINKAFNGNVKKAVQTYFALEREMLLHGDFTFMGHPDLIRKQNGKNVLFDENASWYKNELKETVKAMAKNGCCVEINTSPIVRYGLSTPFPSPYFLSLMKEKNIPVTLGSDCHHKELLDAWFTEGIEYIKKAGYTEITYYTDGSYKFQKI